MERSARRGQSRTPCAPRLLRCSPGFLPEDKYKLVRAFQQRDSIVGMCGDGAHDAPAPRQAQIGIAVSTATDTAKSAAGMVLTDNQMGYDIGVLRTLAFVIGVVGNQATTYTDRERRRLWSSRPSFWVAASSVSDILIASTFAVEGIAMAPLPLAVVAAMLAAAVAFAVIQDFLNVPVFRRLGIAWGLARRSTRPETGRSCREGSWLRLASQTGTISRPSTGFDPEHWGGEPGYWQVWSG
jgi:hypothetical protein